MLLHGWHLDPVMLCNVYLIGVKADRKPTNLRLVNRLLPLVDFFNNFSMTSHFPFLAASINSGSLSIPTNWRIAAIPRVLKAYQMLTSYFLISFAPSFIIVSNNGCEWFILLKFNQSNYRVFRKPYIKITLIGSK